VTVVFRAVAAFLVLPGVVAFGVPVLILRDRVGQRPPGPLGFAVLAVGAVCLLWCVRDFYLAGEGTLAPWDPPRRLVRIGLYRYTRNPMYVAVAIILLGWVATYRFFPLAMYAVIVLIAFHLRVILGEEPWLARNHGDEWRRYAAEVPRWLW
jgi:protein-S-isoprenylcysteine O-methyltransferase Ste14